MSKKNSFSASRAAKAALGTHGFVGHTPELLRSEAWRNRSAHAMRLLDFLEIEHLAHAGKENGFLAAPYDQLATYGIGRRFIKSAIDENIARGLLVVTRPGGRRSGPTRYRLTYLSWKLMGATGPQYITPTNEWRRYTCGKRKKPNGQYPTKVPKMEPNQAAAPKPRCPPPKAKSTTRERERYFKANGKTFGLENAELRWINYEKLILAKYGDDIDDFEAAWKARDRAHSRVN
jgi:hypothetical protein